MGALHEGHLALVERAGETAEIVVVSIFVNPLQFGRGEDLDRYPRGVESDLELLSELGVQFVFAPAVTEMYPSGAVQMTVTAGNAGLLFEGHSRPGHFDGVLTVVAKLLNIVHPDTVVFGEKDAQQVFLVKQMIADLDFEVAVETVITVREPDGLALSSRNRFLDAEERLAADALPRALEAAKSSASRGPDAALAAAQSVLVSDSMAQLDYLAIVDPITFLPVGVDPVKEILSTPLSHSAAPVAPIPVTSCATGCSGTTSRMASTSHSPIAGVNSEGLNTTVLPAARA